VLRVYFPARSRRLAKDFVFDEKFELRRYDYSVNIAGGFPAAQLMLEYTEANGMRSPSKRRAYTRGPDWRPILDMLMVSIDISDVAFSKATSHSECGRCSGIRIRHDLLRFGLLHSHRRSLSDTNLPPGVRQLRKCSAPALRPFAVARPRPVLSLPRTGPPLRAR
jgi:hypothetical protein